MLRFQTLTSYLLFGLHALMGFLWVFQSRVVIPTWLQPLGRMHPLLLHLPIGLLLMVGVLWLFRKSFGEGVSVSIMTFLLALTALSASFAALFGFILSREEGYAIELLTRHQNTGILLSFLCYALWAFYQKRAFTPILAVSTLVLFLTGHLGASLTHGEDYLFPQQNQDNASTFNDNTPVFEAAIQPIFKAKCYQCHNEQKRKGELLMTSLAGLTKGGKNGPVWVAGDALQSHLIQRANLPLEDKKHMPPKGKVQLTPAEIGVLSAWINAGADTKKTVGLLAANDPIKTFLNAAKTPASATPIYNFSAADPATVQQLNTPFRVIVPLAHDSPALQANFFVRQAFESAHLSELKPLKTQLVSLNLSNMPVKDEDLKTIAQFENLEKVILNNTDITAKGMATLKGLKGLTSLSLSGTKVNADGLRDVLALPKLKEVFVWNTPLNTAQQQALQKQFPRVRIEQGYVPKSSEQLKLNPPILVNEKFVLTDQSPVAFKHPLKGVTIRYTTDGTAPDSTTSTVYQKPLVLEDYTVVQVRAVKEGWYASEPIEYTFFKGKYRPTTVELLQKPNPQYVGEGGKTLTDQQKGDPADFKNKAWLGYRETPFEALFGFAQSTPLKSLTISTGRNIGGFIFPPTVVEIWGGNDKQNLKLLQKITPEAPTKVDRARIEAIRVMLHNESYTYLKIIARPIGKLPAWHPGKGQPGWVFVDEVFFN